MEEYHINQDSLGMTDFFNSHNVSYKEWLEMIKAKGFSNSAEYFRWRRNTIYEQRESGRTFKSIGEEHGISGTRASQVYRQTL